MHLRLVILIFASIVYMPSGYSQDLTEEELFGTEDTATQQTIDDLEKQIEKELSTTQDPGLNQQVVPQEASPEVLPEAAQPEPLVSPEPVAEQPPDPIILPEENDLQPESNLEAAEVLPPQEPELRAQEPEAPLKSLDLENAELVYPASVELESSVYHSNPEKRCNCSFNYLKPYTERRPTVGFNLSVGYSSYSPLDYKPDFVVNNTFENYFGAAESPLVEATLGPKLNMSLGSIALDLGAGYYNNENRDLGNLKLIPVRAGVTYALDNLAKDPIFVPYGSVGGYMIYYEEKLASQKVGGNTAPGLYYAGGLAIQLNWLDETSASIAYDETGLENTYLFVEGRSFVLAGNLPNLSSEIQWGAGMRLEY